MSWHIGLTKHSAQIEKWDVYSCVQDDGLTRYFTGGLHLEYTLAHDDEGQPIDAERFVALCRRVKVSEDGNGCPACGRPIVEAHGNSVYCSVSCYNTAKWRRSNERKKAS